MANPLEGVETTERVRQAKQQLTTQWRRRLTLNILVEAEAADDSNLAPLVDAAVREFLESPPGQGIGPESMKGKFESAGGLDVTWRALNSYYVGDRLVGESGVSADGKGVDWFDFAAGKPKEGA